jgi:hypothetical protein
MMHHTEQFSCNCRRYWTRMLFALHNGLPVHYEVYAFVSRTSPYLDRMTKSTQEVRHFLLKTLTVKRTPEIKLSTPFICHLLSLLILDPRLIRSDVALVAFVRGECARSGR